MAEDFRSMMAGVRKAIEDTKQTVAGAVQELNTEIVEGGKAAAKQIRQEARTVREGYAELLGNQPHGGPEKPVDASKPNGPGPGPSGGAAAPGPFPADPSPGRT